MVDELFKRVMEEEEDEDEDESKDSIDLSENYSEEENDEI